MKFFNSHISMNKPLSVADAVKNMKDAPKGRSLDDIIASTKTIKTAAAETAVVTASKEEAPQVTVQVKVASENPFAKKDEDEKKENGEEKKDDKKGEEKKNPFLDFIKEKKEKKDDKKEEKEASTSKTLKMAKSLDFRGWEATKVVSAWKAAGTLQDCVASVKGLTNDPQTYCGLLRVAAQTATTVIKTASEKKKTATAKKEVKSASPVFKKLAKLTESERSELISYWTELYGEGYAKAMLEDY